MSASLTPYAARWRWRRAATPFPRPEDVESVPPAAAAWRYAVQDEDVGQFLRQAGRHPQARTLNAFALDALKSLAFRQPLLKVAPNG